MMNRKVFIAEDYANRILQCKQRLFEFYKQNGYLEEIEKVNDIISKIAPKDQIRIAFIGQYSAGKSTIISALTGNKDIRIDSNIATDTAKSYDWSSGVILTDTPGLYTEYKEHSDRAIEAIRESDLVVYCITSDLFDKYTKEDFMKWAFEESYKEKMFLAINKMSKEAGMYEELVNNYTITLNRTLSPYTLAEIPHAFFDAKDYRGGLDCQDQELINFSHFEDFIEKLNDFVIQKGELGKLDTPIRILEASIDKFTEERENTNKDKAFVQTLAQIENWVKDYRKQVKDDINDCIDQVANDINQKGHQVSELLGIQKISNNDINTYIQEKCNILNRQLSQIIESNINELQTEVQEIMNSDKVTFFFNSVQSSISGSSTLFKSKQDKIDKAQFDAMNNVFQGILGKTVELSTDGGRSGLLAKIIGKSDALNSTVYKDIKKVGNLFGFKLGKKQVVQITEKIGSAASIASMTFAAVGSLFEVKEIIDEAKREEQIEKSRLECIQYFEAAAKELKLNFLENTKGLFDVYDEIIKEIENQRNAVQEKKNKNDLIDRELLNIRNDLISIQKSIYHG